MRLYIFFLWRIEIRHNNCIICLDWVQIIQNAGTQMSIKLQLVKLGSILWNRVQRSCTTIAFVPIFAISNMLFSNIMLEMLVEPQVLRISLTTQQWLDWASTWNLQTEPWRICGLKQDQQNLCRKQHILVKANYMEQKSLHTNCQQDHHNWI